MRFTLRQLQVFLATAQQQNISLAAEQLGMSQSAASGALKELEQRYEVQLFDRVGKRLQLNDTGRALRPVAEAVLHKAGAFEAAITDGPDYAPLNVGATLTIGNYLAVDIIAAHTQRYPGTQIKLHVANTLKIKTGLLNFELDIGLIEGEINDPELQVQTWLKDELQVFCSPQHPLAQTNSLSDQDLLSAKWILRELGSGTRRTFNNAMQGILPQLDVIMELEHTEAIKRAVESNLGISCLSAISLAPALARGDIVALNVPQRNLQRQFYIVSHNRKHFSTSMNNWVDSCLAAAAQSDAIGRPID